MLGVNKAYEVLAVIGALFLLWYFISLYVEGKNYVDSEDDEEKKQIGEDMKFVGIVGIVGILGCAVVQILYLCGVVQL